MRTLWLVPWLAAVLTTPASAQEVKLEELVNTTVESRVFRAQTVRREGKEYPGIVQSDVEIVIGNLGEHVKFTQTNTWHGRKGKTTWTTTGSGPLGRPRAARGAGGGHGVGVFMNGTAYYIRTFKSGGFKFEFKFGRTSKGLTCAARETFLKERGTDEIRLNSNIDNHPLVVVSDKQISSTCRVIKR